mgnify:CR=1 FL=1
MTGLTKILSIFMILLGRTFTEVSCSVSLTRTIWKLIYSEISITLNTIVWWILTKLTLILITGWTNQLSLDFIISWLTNTIRRVMSVLRLSTGETILSICVWTCTTFRILTLKTICWIRWFIEIIRTWTTGRIILSILSLTNSAITNTTLTRRTSMNTCETISQSNL